MKIQYLFLSIVLTGCSTLDNSRIAGGYVQAYKAVSSLLFGYEDSFITADLIKEIPYASQTLKIGKGPKGLMILESINVNQYTWVSSDNVYIVEENGKILKTSGLINNIKSLNFFRSVEFFRINYEVQINFCKTFFSQLFSSRKDYIFHFICS